MKSQAAFFLVASVSLAASLSIASADTIELKDGRRISGSIARQADTYLIRAEDGTTVSAAAADVVRITLDNIGSSAAAVDPAQSEWSRIAIQIKQSPDLQAIIKLQQQFLQKYPAVPLAKEVGESLDNYQKLADVGGVKYHGQWMMPDQLDSALEASAQAARPALDAYVAGRIKEALEIANTILAKDSQNPDALTIAGLAAYRSGNVSLARKDFASLTDADPTYVLAQNNLAVIGYQQKQTSEVLLHYTRGLRATHNDLLLLNNVAEAIHSYKSAGGNVASTDFRALADAYAAAETAAEAAMAKVGIRRLGSAWLTQEQFETAAHDRQALHDKSTLLEAQYQATSAAIASMDPIIKQVTAQYDNSSGLSYADFNRVSSQKGSLEGKRNVLVSRLADLSAQAQTLKSQIAASENLFTGEQVIMDIVVPPDLQSAAQPAPLAGAAIPPPLPAPAPAITAVPVPADATANSTLSQPDPVEDPPYVPSAPIPPPYRYQLTRSSRSSVGEPPPGPPKKWKPPIPALWHFDQNGNVVVDPVFFVYNGHLFYLPAATGGPDGYSGIRYLKDLTGVAPGGK